MARSNKPAVMYGPAHPKDLLKQVQANLKVNERENKQLKSGVKELEGAVRSLKSAKQQAAKRRSKEAELQRLQVKFEKHARPAAEAAYTKIQEMFLRVGVEGRDFTPAERRQISKLQKKIDSVKQGFAKWAKGEPGRKAARAKKKEGKSVKKASKKAGKKASKKSGKFTSRKGPKLTGAKLAELKKNAKANPFGKKKGKKAGKKTSKKAGKKSSKKALAKTSTSHMGAYPSDKGLKRTRAVKAALRSADNGTLTAADVMKISRTHQLKSWICGGPKRSGCGGGKDRGHTLMVLNKG